MCEDLDCEHHREEVLIEGCESQVIVDSFNRIVVDPCKEEINEEVAAHISVQAWGECAKDGIEDARYVFFESLPTIILLKTTEGERSNDKIIKLLLDGIQSYQERVGYVQKEEKEWYIKGSRMIAQRIPSFVKNLKI